MNKPSLLLLHGALGSKQQFEPLSKALEEHFDVHSLDFDGHGSVPASRQTFRIEHFAEDVALYLERGNLTSVHIFGYSMGGYVALYLANKQPQRIQSIITLGTKFAWNPETAAKEASMLNPERMKEKIPSFVKRLEMLHPASDWASVVEKTKEMMITLGNAPLLDATALVAIQQRVRISIGDRDEMVTLEETVSAHKALRASELAVLPNTPHVLEKVNIKRLSMMITDFVMNL